MKAKVNKRAVIKVNKPKPRAIHKNPIANSQEVLRDIHTVTGLTAYKLEILKVVTNLQVELACAIDNLRSAAAPLRDQDKQGEGGKV